MVVAVKWYGTAVLEITFKTAKGIWAVNFSTEKMKRRLKFRTTACPGVLTRTQTCCALFPIAHIFDPYLAVHTSDIEPLPHQISAVYQEMLGRLPLRYILADDPGAGKTIMTGLFIRELIARGAVKRYLIVSPGNLAEQWQDELYRKFQLRFVILIN
ncbi:hypothetical protein AGMMS49925_10290 [Deltaproteobacteria bacterium]|nr:hypothetical protein AGMMS49925_10290 [Deltaproteobacteria bacterium]